MDGGPGIVGLAARYGREETFIAAVRAAVEAGYRRIECYSPFPVEGCEVPGRGPGPLQWAVFLAGAAGGIGGFFMLYYANVLDYPLDIGGRPFNSWPAFIPIAFELTILLAALCGFAAFLLSCRLPRLHHPIFGVPGFERATMDAFFLCIAADDRRFDGERTRRFLEETGAESVHGVEP